MYSLYVYDEDLLRQGVVEDIDSLQWLSLYAGAGEVKLVCAATDKNLDLLRRGRRLWCTEQPESAVIAQIEISDTGEKATMTVRAPLSTNRWARRVAMWTTLVKNVETAMYKLVNDNRRGLPGASAKPMGLTPVTDSQTSWGSVLESLEELAEAHGLGFRETFDPATGVEMFCVYQGTDRSSEGSDAFVGYLGDDIGNLADIRIVDSDANWKNVAVVGGQDQGADRKVVTVAHRFRQRFANHRMQRTFPPRIKSPRRPEKWMRTEILNIRTPNTPTQTLSTRRCSGYGVLKNLLRR